MAGGTENKGGLRVNVFIRLRPQFYPTRARFILQKILLEEKKGIRRIFEKIFGLRCRRLFH